MNYQEDISIFDSFNLMKDFLDLYWKETGSNKYEIADLLSSLGAGGPGNYLPLDPSLWDMWERAAKSLVKFEGADIDSR